MPATRRLSAALFASLVTLAAAGLASAQAPRAAVARIVVQEADGVAQGSGALIDARGEYGLVVTNWHVVRDATGPIEVLFPSGFRSRARSLKLDDDWDLAALVIWRPPTSPLRLASAAPRPGDPLTICGYGPGPYREATGRCTEYYAPGVGLPQELVELDVAARQGDSGGPILNQRGEVAGVLFGSGQGTTLGSFGGRVGRFLASLSPGIQTPGNPAGVGRPANTAIASAPPPANAPQRVAATMARRDLAPPPARSEPVDRYGALAAADRSAPGEPSTERPTATLPAANAITGQPSPPPPVVALIPGVGQPAASASDVPGWFDTARSIFAAIGVGFVCLQLVRLAT
ncbi:MAG: trypsin-like peptidase domain-containing protein [Planctomycetota bacterium]